MERRLIIQSYAPDGKIPENKFAVPLFTLTFLEKLLSRKTRAILAETGMDFTELAESLPSGSFGKLIEVENKKGKLAVFIE